MSHRRSGSGQSVGDVGSGLHRRLTRRVDSRLPLCPADGPLAPHDIAGQPHRHAAGPDRQRVEERESVDHTSPEFWMNLQVRYDLATSRPKKLVKSVRRAAKQARSGAKRRGLPGLRQTEWAEELLGENLA